MQTVFDFMSGVIALDATNAPTEAELMVNDIVPGLIEESTINLIAAPGFAGKSWVALGIARMVNDPSFKFLNFQCDNARPVLYIDKEMGTKQFKRRWNRFGGEWVEGSTFHYADMCGQTWSLAFKEHVYALLEFVQKNGIELVVIDGLLACSAGVEENSNSGLMLVMDNLKILKPYCSVIFLHHTVKSAKPGDLDSSAIRGAGVVRDQCDNVFLVNRHEGSHRSLRENKRRDKEGELEDYPFEFCWNETAKRLTLMPEDKMKPISADFQRVCEFLMEQTEGVSGNGLKKALRQAGLTIKNDDFNPMLERMEREGFIEIDRTSARGWKISITAHGRERFADDLMTAEADEDDALICDQCGEYSCVCEDEE